MQPPCCNSRGLRMWKRRIFPVQTSPWGVISPPFLMSTTTSTTRELYDRYVIPTYARFDLRLARGCGTEVWDEDGKRYLDFGAGIAVTSIGHAHPRVIAAMQK